VLQQRLQQPREQPYFKSL